MLPQEEKDFVKGAFEKLKERGWLSGEELKPSAITEQEIADFEQKHGVTLPSLYKAFLTSYRLPMVDNEICSIIDDWGDVGPRWLMLYSPESMEDVSNAMENLQTIRDFCDLPEDSFRNLIPIGDWGAGWGSLCIDLTRDEEQADEDNMKTWSLVWFDHEDFEWDKQYLGEDGLLHGRGALLNFKELLNLYFYGSLEEVYEQEEGVKPTYEWYQATLEEY